MAEEIKILLVEDNPGDSRIIREMLLEGVREQIVIDVVITLRQAQVIPDKNQYDAILLDLSLPDSHGIDTLLKMEAEFSEVPIVVLTGNNDDGLGVEAVQMGAQDYLPKIDVDSRLLIRSIRYAIERHHIEVALRKSEEEYRSLIDDVFDTSMVAVLILDNKFRVVWCNEATEIYFGIERDRLVGRDKRQLIDVELKCLFADPDDYSARLLQAYDEGIFTDRFECHIIPDQNREERWLEHWSQPIREGIYAGGRIEQYTDITERKVLEVAERDQREFAEALTDISKLVTSSLDLNHVFNTLLTNLGRIVPHDSASITLIEDDHFQVVYQKSNDKRDTQELIAEKKLQIDYKPYAEMMLITGEPVFVADMQADPQLDRLAKEANIRGYAGAPIVLQNKVIGFINLLSEKIGFFDEPQAGRLSALAGLAATAIQNARLFNQSRQLAALEERQRLARELHDSVSQTLFTCRVLSESALRRWDKDPQRAHELIQDVNQLSMSALAEMRILLLELRPNAMSGVSLEQLFEQYLKPIQERREFDLVLSLDDIPPLPADVQFALYRITQEALNNIDKHAQATRVEVHIKNTVENVMLEVIDNGSGFEIEKTPSTSFGLGIMQERASNIGAQINIDSQLHRGTKIEVIWSKDRVDGKN